MKAGFHLAGAVIFLGAIGCYQPDPELSPPPPPQFEADVGEAEGTEFRDQVPRVLTRNSFELEDRNEPPSPRVRTGWLPRDPFPDEREVGADAARTRVVVRGIPVRDSSKYLVTVLVLNEIRFTESTTWMEIEATPLFTEYADGITRALAAGIHGG